LCACRRCAGRFATLFIMYSDCNLCNRRGLSVRRADPNGSQIWGGFCGAICDFVILRCNLGCRALPGRSHQCAHGGFEGPGPWVRPLPRCCLVVTRGLSMVEYEGQGPRREDSSGHSRGGCVGFRAGHVGIATLAALANLWGRWWRMPPHGGHESKLMLVSPRVQCPSLGRMYRGGEDVFYASH
jgi:hypothetical protein